jgi:hypothetical protein
MEQPLELKDFEDGITHINIYSKGKTELGRMLSNFYKFPIKTLDGDFMSVEGYWYWLSIDENTPEREELRKLYGFKVKQRGKEILDKTNNGKSSRFDEDFERKILRAIWYKFRRCSDLIKPEYANLPIVHYYCYGGKVIDVTDKYEWMIKGIEKMRNYLLNPADKKKTHKEKIYTCSRCGGTLEPVWYTEREYYPNSNTPTGRTRRNVNYLQCVSCLNKEIVDSDTFAQSWRQ